MTDQPPPPPGNYPPPPPPPPGGGYPPPPPPQGGGYPPPPPPGGGYPPPPPQAEASRRRPPVRRRAALPKEAYTPWLTRVLAYLIDYIPYAIIVGIGYGVCCSAPRKRRASPTRPSTTSATSARRAHPRSARCLSPSAAIVAIAYLDLEPRLSAGHNGLEHRQVDHEVQDRQRKDRAANRFRDVRGARALYCSGRRRLRHRLARRGPVPAVGCQAADAGRQDHQANDLQSPHLGPYTEIRRSAMTDQPPPGSYPPPPGGYPPPPPRGGYPPPPRRAVIRLHRSRAAIRRHRSRVAIRRRRSRVGYPPPPQGGGYPPPPGRLPAAVRPRPGPALPKEAYTPWFTRVLAWLIDNVPVFIVVGIGVGHRVRHRRQPTALPAATGTATACTARRASSAIGCDRARPGLHRGRWPTWSGTTATGRAPPGSASARR